jgi:hypothetical protein
LLPTTGGFGTTCSRAVDDVVRATVAAAAVVSDAFGSSSVDGTTVTRRSVVVVGRAGGDIFPQFATRFGAH